VPDSPLWDLKDFDWHLDIWIRNEEPDQDLINEVSEWVLSRFDDPYRDMKREPGFDNLWFGPIPHTTWGSMVVTCSYMIVESDHRVYCKSIATLSRPV
jgi:hypothetical protein